jgi:predicted DNA-binding transcriptional regulator AlpA
MPSSNTKERLPRPDPGMRLAQPRGKPTDVLYITSAQLRQRYGGLSHMWVERKIQNDPDFPRPVYFGTNFRFFKLAEIEEYERKCALKSAGKVA